MKPNLKLEVAALTYSGTLPLIILAAYKFIPNTPSLDTVLIAAAYSAVILSFLCGIHWAIFLFFAEKCPHNLLITSNIIALLAWASLLDVHSDTSKLLQQLCFLYLLTLDLRLRDASVLPAWFYTIRRNATAIVIFCLAIIMIP
jgi:hypothetical protein